MSLLHEACRECGKTRVWSPGRGLCQTCHRDLAIRARHAKFPSGRLARSVCQDELLAVEDISSQGVVSAEATVNVLVSLHRGYGLGDGVQVSAVLRHLAKYRPEWRIDYQAEEGKHQVGRGIVANTFAYGEYPPTRHYDAEVQIVLYDTWANWGDRPNTRVSSCLHETFGLGWDAECGRYRVQVSSEALAAAEVLTKPQAWLRKKRKLCADVREWATRHIKRVAVHYQGDSSPAQKNLTHDQAASICEGVEKLGRMPLLLDWRNVSPIVNECDVQTTGRLPVSRQWGSSAEMNCAVISKCEAFVGIDSGPSKCASATDTPALVIWTGHHPAPFHDPAPNSTHLVPRGYHGLQPVCNDAGVIKWFEKNYLVREYDDDPVNEVKAWLREVLK